MAAPNIDDQTDFREVMGGDNRGVLVGATTRHGRVENCRGLGIPREVLEVIHPEGVSEAGLPGLDTVVEGSIRPLPSN